jgi:hypothetical protein
LENAKIKIQKMYLAINAQIFLLQYAEQMEEIIKIPANAHAKEVAKNILKEDVQWKNHVPDVLVC